MSHVNTPAVERLAPSVVIRPVGLGEALAVAGVHVQADRETYEPLFGVHFQEVALDVSLSRWEAALTAGDVFLVAEERGQVVGFVHASETWMSSLYLLASHLRRGIGSRLLNAMRAELKARGVTDIGFKAVADNVRAVAFYDAQGARQLGRQKAEDGGATWEDIFFALTV
ncbi:MAG TPA: GNAT family N-acetyltransferase [Caulobacteraceae bacterium]|jgi:GNAT superfamily N-acetyltransferase